MKFPSVKIKLFLSLFFCVLISNSGFATQQMLSPPWYLLQSKLSAALNTDPCIHVENVTGEGQNMEIRVLACDEKKAQALATFVNHRYEFGDLIAVTVMVYSPDLVPVEALTPDSVEDTAKLLSRALTGNKYFVKTGLGYSPAAQPSAYAIFKPEVVQYHSDDISDWYLNTNVVAATLFSELLNLKPFDEKAHKVFATTAPVRMDKLT